MNELYQLRSAIEVLEEESRSLQEHKKLREELQNAIDDHRKRLAQLSDIQQAHQSLKEELAHVKQVNTLLHQGHTEQQKQLKVLLEHIQRVEKRLWIGGGLLSAGMVAMLIMLLTK